MPQRGRGQGWREAWASKTSACVYRNQWAPPTPVVLVQAVQTVLCGQNSRFPQHTNIWSINPLTLVHFKAPSLLHSFLTIQRLYLLTQPCEHPIRYHGPTIISHGAATPLPDIHCSNLGYCYAYAAWHARTRLNNGSTKRSRHQPIRYTFRLRARLAECLVFCS